MNPSTHLLQHRDAPEIPRRFQRVIDLLRERPMTIPQLAEALKIEKSTARVYVSEATRYTPILASGPWGATTYSVVVA